MVFSLLLDLQACLFHKKEKKEHKEVQEIQYLDLLECLELKVQKDELALEDLQELPVYQGKKAQGEMLAFQEIQVPVDLQDHPARL